MKPKIWQIETAETLFKLGRVIYADPVGVGKTLVAILAAMKTPEPALIISTKLAINVSWIEQLKLWVPDESFEVVSKSSELGRFLKPAKFYLISFDLAIKNETFIRNVHKNLGWVIIDEAHKIPDRKSAGFLGLLRLTYTTSSRLMLIAPAPIRKNLGEVWRFYHLLYSKLYRSYHAWADKKLVPDPRFRGRFENFPLDAKEFKEEFDLYCITSGERIELESETIKVQLTPKRDQAKLIQSLLDDAWLALPNGEFWYAHGFLALFFKVIEAGNNPAILGRLESSVVTEWLLEFVDSHDEQVLIGSISAKTLKMLKGVLPNYDYITGETSSAQRVKLQADFISGKLRYLGLSMEIAESITLTNCRLIVAIDRPWVYSVYDQFLGRCLRNSQTRKVIIYELSKTEMDEKCDDILALDREVIEQSTK